MTPKQRKFCDEYLISLNGADAAIKAGYSPKTAKTIASENLTKPNIRAYIEGQMDSLHTQKTADAAEVLEYLTAVLRGETLAEIVVVEGTGEGCSKAKTISKAPDEKERLKAAELLGKRHGIFTEKLNLEGALPVIISGSDDLED